MDFELTDELKMLKEMAYKFAQSEFAGMSHECDRDEKYTPDIRKKAAENGLIGAWIPEEYGGAGAGFLGNAIIMEELSKVDMGIALEEAKRMRLALPGLALASQLYLSVSALGHGRLGTQALELALAAMSGIDWKKR